MEIKENKYREIISYLIVGILTTIVSFGSYYLLTLSLLNPGNSKELQIANVISWVLAVLFAYITNKKYVFKSKEKNILKEGTTFCLSRVFTLLLDMLTMFLMVSVFHINDRISKLVSQIFITIGNYIISKFLVFKKNKNNNSLNTIYKTILIIFSGIIIGSILLILSYSLPVGRMRINATNASVTFEKEGTYPMLINGYPNTQLDNYTDAIIINEAIFKSNDSVIDKAMYVYRNNKVDPLYDVIHSIRNDEFEFRKSDYARYWHGNIVPVKLLLLLFDYSQIRIINLVIQTILLLYILYLMIKNNLEDNIPDLVCSLFLIFPFALGMSLQFSSVYYILLIALIVMIKFNNKLKDKYIYFFLIIGIITSYLDLLSFPLLPLGMSLLFNLMLNKKESLKENLLVIIKYSLFWAIGYFGMWLGKWLVGSILCHDNFFKVALESAKYRSSTGTVSRFNSIIKNIRVYINKAHFIILFPLFCYHIYHVIRNRHNITIKDIYGSIPYIVIAFIPICWYAMMSQHSEMHFWFTNKSLIISIYSGLLLLNNLCHKYKGEK